VGVNESCKPAIYLDVVFVTEIDFGRKPHIKDLGPTAARQNLDLVRVEN